MYRHIAHFFVGNHYSVCRGNLTIVKYPPFHAFNSCIYFIDPGENYQWNLRESGHFENISKTVGLVDFLDSCADRESCRLRRYTTDTVFGGPEELKDLDLASSPIDPEQSIVEESVFEVLSRNPSGFFSKGIVYLNEWLMYSTEQDAKKRHDSLPRKVLQFVYSHRIFFGVFIGILVFILLWLRYG